MRVGNEDLLSVDGTRATKSLAANATVKPLWLGHISDYSIQLVFTGTPAGTFKLQASVDAGSPSAQGDAAKYSAVVNWTDVPSSSQVVAAAGTVMWNIVDAGYNWVRVVYTDGGTGGTGTLTSARAYVKGV